MIASRQERGLVCYSAVNVSNLYRMNVARGVRNSVTLTTGEFGFDESELRSQNAGNGTGMAAMSGELEGELINGGSICSEITKEGSDIWISCGECLDTVQDGNGKDSVLLLKCARLQLRGERGKRLLNTKLPRRESVSRCSSQSIN